MNNIESERACMSHKCLKCGKKLHTHSMLYTTILFIIMGAFFYGLFASMNWSMDRISPPYCRLEAIDGIQKSTGKEAWMGIEIDCDDFQEGRD